MKLSVLTMAAAALPMVSPAYRGLASAVLDELRTYQQKAADQAAHIERLTKAVKQLQDNTTKLTNAVNDQTAVSRDLLAVQEVHTDHLARLSH
jgi:uncharacterized protein YlxW (UPF0749 family)